jgi:hypothetical protein
VNHETNLAMILPLARRHPCGRHTYSLGRLPLVGRPRSPRAGGRAGEAGRAVGRAVGWVGGSLGGRKAGRASGRMGESNQSVELSFFLWLNAIRIIMNLVLGCEATSIILDLGHSSNSCSCAVQRPRCGNSLGWYS